MARPDYSEFTPLSEHEKREITGLWFGPNFAQAHQQPHCRLWCAGADAALDPADCQNRQNKRGKDDNRDDAKKPFG